MLKAEFILKDSPEYTQQITEKFRKKFEKARTDQRFEPLVVYSKHFNSSFHNQILILQLNQSYEQRSFGLLVYDKDPSLLGKSLRLLVHLEDKYQLYQYLQDEGIVRIIVTTATDPLKITDYNKWVFETKESLGLVKQLIQLQATSKNRFEEGIYTLVKDNKG